MHIDFSIWPVDIGKSNFDFHRLTRPFSISMAMNMPIAQKAAAGRRNKTGPARGNTSCSRNQAGNKAGFPTLFPYILLFAQDRVSSNGIPAHRHRQADSVCRSLPGHFLVGWS
jgi:hypothetical protein